MIRVLFVCLGNICRSPMAEGVFQDLVNRAGLSEHILVDSAGTGHWHVGENAHPGTRDVLRRNGISLSRRARQIDVSEIPDVDYLVAMDTSNFADLGRLDGRAQSDGRLFMLLDFAPDGGPVDGAVAAGAPATGPTVGQTETPGPEKPPAEQPEAREVVLKNSLFEATFTSRGARLKSFKLAAYKERDENKPEEQLGPENLVSTTDEARLPLGIRFRAENTSFKLASYIDWNVTKADQDEVVFRFADPEDAHAFLRTLAQEDISLYR